MIEGVRRAMDYRATDYEVINLGNSHTVRLLEMVRALEGFIRKKADLEFLPEQPAEVSKAEQLLVYMPRTEFEDGLRRFVEWLRGR